MHCSVFIYSESSLSCTVNFVPCWRLNGTRKRMDSNNIFVKYLWAKTTEVMQQRRLKMRKSWLLEKRKRSRRVRPESVLIRPTEEQKNPDELKIVCSKMEPEEMKVQIKSIRETKNRRSLGRSGRYPRIKSYIW